MLQHCGGELLQITAYFTPGLHLGNDSRGGGKIRFYESKGGGGGGDGVNIRVCKHMASRGVWGHALQKFLYFSVDACFCNCSL